jgi:hypothetical protein
MVDATAGEKFGSSSRSTWEFYGVRETRFMQKDAHVLARSWLELINPSRWQLNLYRIIFWTPAVCKTVLSQVSNHIVDIRHSTTKLDLQPLVELVWKSPKLLI